MIDSKKFQHIMVDIETLGTNELPPILAVGAVEFNLQTGETGETFYYNVDMKDCINVWNMKPCGETIKWWFDQEQEARDHLFTPHPKKLAHVLTELASFIDGRYVWGNGSNFDNRIIRGAYNLTGIKVPWHFRKDMDVRTLVTLGTVLGIPKYDKKFEGVRHNAVHDAIHQVNYCTHIIKRIKEKMGV